MSQEKDERRVCRQALPRRRYWYPVWGDEFESRRMAGWSIYRHGQQDILDRYVITPKALPVLDYGVTVLDILVVLGVFGFVAWCAMLICGMDGCLDALGV